MPYSSSQKRKDCLKRFYAKRRKNGLCIRCGLPAEPRHTHCVPCGHKMSLAHSNRLNHLRALVIDGYGGRCACCGETLREFMSIDHVGHRACDEIKIFGRNLTTTELCHLILKENFPSRFQILCFNCNMSLGIFGYCPHHPEIRRPITKGCRHEN